MAKNWFLVPYESDVNAKPMPRRWCAMDKHTPAIRAAGGSWEETEITGNQALVFVSAPQAVLNTIGQEFPAVSPSEMNTKYRNKPLTRIPPRFDPVKNEIVFDKQPVQVIKTVEDIERKIK